MAEENKNDQKGEGPRKPIIRTMVSDVQEYLKGKKFSLTDLLAQKEKRAEEGFEEPWTERFKPAFYFLALILAVIFIGFGAFWLRKAALEPKVPKPVQPAAIIPASVVKTIELDSPTRDSFLNEWSGYFNLRLLPREFGQIIIFDISQNKFLEAKDLFELLKINLPPLLSAGLEGPMTIGVMDTPRGNEPIFIFKIKSFSDAFAGMLNWEKDLPAALEGLLSTEISLFRADNNFQDVVVANHDARLLKNKGGENILVYAIFNRRFLILAQSPRALETIVKQLSLFPPQ